MIHARLAGVVVAAGLIGVAALAYTPTLEFGYAQDSWPAVKANPVVERGDLREVFTSDYWKGTGSFARTLYRPVAVASFAIERRLSGEADPRLSHLINILLHGLTAWLFYRLSRVLGAAEPVAIAAAVLFVLHPLALHTVANVVGRADTLAVLFSLVALRCLASPRRRLAAWGMAAAVWLALGSKEIGAAVVPLLAVAEAIYRFPRGDARDAWRDRLAVFGPTVAAVLLYLHLRTLAIGEFPGWQPLAIEDNLLVGLSGLQRVATTLAMAGRYALLSVAPVGLSPDYSGGVIQAETSLLAPLPLLGVALSAAGIALVALGIPRGGGAPGPTRRLCRFAAALVVVPYLFVGNVLTLNAAGFAERMVYFSSTGFCLLVAIAAGAAIARLAAGRVRVTRAAWVAVVVVCASLELVQLRRHLPMWEDNRALFDYTARVAPRSLRAALQVAGRHEAEGRPDEALEIYRRIETFAPDYGGAWMARGRLLVAAGDLAGAERALRRSVELAPGVGAAQFQLAMVLLRRGKSAEAERALRRALLYDPARLEAAVQLAHLLYAHGRYAEAARFYEGCVRLGRADLRRQLAAARERARSGG